MAKRLDVTTMAVRQHLAVLEAEKLVGFTDEGRKVGRSARLWRLTARAYDRCAHCHAELAVGMLQAVQSASGEQGLELLTEERVRQQLEIYRARMPGPGAPLDHPCVAAVRGRLHGRVAAPARWNDRARGEPLLHREGGTLLPEALRCELSLFRAVLGEDVSVERVEHILSGGRCCTYRIIERLNEPVSDNP